MDAASGRGTSILNQTTRPRPVPRWAPHVLESFLTG
jgi:hypothetical protein